jgi:hypothetical protein
MPSIPLQRYFDPGRTGPVAPGVKIFAVYLLFMRSGSDGFCMGPDAIAHLILCIAAISAAGCMTNSMGPAITTTMPPSLPQTLPAATVSIQPVAECGSIADCVPAECCHPSRCIPGPRKTPCTLMCTMSCEGPLDCGAGSCGCVSGTCSIVPAPSELPESRQGIVITIKASPQRYSPIMSSTPGVGLEPVITGFSAANASFAWNTTYGQFLSWNSPDFTVNQLGDSASNHGEKLYWSFTGRPSSTATPVTITVTATDTASGRLLGRSTVTLAWEGNYSVAVNTSE